MARVWFGPLSWGYVISTCLGGYACIKTISSASKELQKQVLLFWSLRFKHVTDAKHPRGGEPQLMVFVNLVVSFRAIQWLYSSLISTRSRTRRPFIWYKYQTVSVLALQELAALHPPRPEYEWKEINYDCHTTAVWGSSTTGFAATAAWSSAGFPIVAADVSAAARTASRIFSSTISSNSRVIIA